MLCFSSNWVWSSQWLFEQKFRNKIQKFGQALLWNLAKFSFGYFKLNEFSKWFIAHAQMFSISVAIGFFVFGLNSGSTQRVLPKRMSWRVLVDSGYELVWAWKRNWNSLFLHLKWFCFLCIFVAISFFYIFDRILQHPLLRFPTSHHSSLTTKIWFALNVNVKYIFKWCTKYRITTTKATKKYNKNNLNKIKKENLKFI